MRHAPRARASCSAPSTSAAWTSSAPALKRRRREPARRGRRHDLRPPLRPSRREARARQRHLPHRLAQPARHLPRAARRARTSCSSATAATGAATCPVELCGEATTLPIGPATLAAKTGAPMMPVACRRTGTTASWRAACHRSTAPAPSRASCTAPPRSSPTRSARSSSRTPASGTCSGPVWPQTDADRAHARAALEAARRGEDWTRIEV